MDNVTTEMIDRLEPDQLAELPPGVLNDLHWMLAEEATVQKRREAALYGAFERRWSQKATVERLKAGKDTGTVHLTDGEYDVCITVPKKVTWDQTKLKAALNTLPPDTAAHYAKSVFSVEERKFEAAPPDIRGVFAAARTVAGGKTAYALSPLKQAEAAA